MYGRVPDYLRESDIIKDLWDRRMDGSSNILRQGRLITVYAPQSAPPPGMISGWMQHEFSYPSLVYPLEQMTPAPGAAQSGKLFAHIGERPDIDTLAQNVGFAHMSHDGMLWIPFPGKWWLLYDGTVDTRLDCVVYDDTCGGAQHMTGKRGCIIQENGQTNVTTAAASNIIAENPFRDGVVIQNQGTVDVWIRRGAAAGATPAAVGAGYKLPPDETLPLIGAMAWKGALNGRADGVDCLVHVQEILS